MKILFFVLIVVSSLGMIGCPGCDDLDYLAVDSINFTFNNPMTDEFPPTSDSSILSGDTSFVGLGMSTKFIARSNAWPVNIANAQSCDHGSKGIKDRVTQIVFTSNQPFHGIPPGESINSYVYGYVITRIDGQSHVSSTNSVASQLPSINNYGGRSFLITPPPPEDLFRRFYTTLHFMSGRQLVDSTIIVKW